MCAGLLAGMPNLIAMFPLVFKMSNHMYEIDTAITGGCTVNALSRSGCKNGVVVEYISTR